MNEIRHSFAQYFEGLDIQLPDPVPARGHIGKAGWAITYVLLQDEQGRPYLEFTASHRLTNPRHVSILHNGEEIALSSFQEDYTYDPDVPGDEEAAQARMTAHNEAVAEDLRKKGLL